jgi:multiple sugar transport system ATP-binding protein
MADIQLTNLGKRFGSIEAVSGVNLHAASGEFIVLLGPSGAGKTTTLRLVAGLETPDAGQVHIGGRDVTTLAPALRDVAFVFQQYSLYPHLSVFDNLAFPLRSPIRPTPEPEIKRKVLEIASMLRIDDKLQNPATKLSGGQMQRVAIGRALVRSPALYLMDEPLSSLDAKLRNDLRLELKRVQQDLGATMLYVTHDQTEALTMATRIGVLDAGRLVQLGTPQEVYENPQTVQAASRLGSPRINLLPRSAVGSLGLPPNAQTIGVRSEGMTVAALHKGAGQGGQQAAHVTGHITSHITGHIQRIEHISDERHLHLRMTPSGDAAPVEMVTLCHDLTGLHTGCEVAVCFTAPLFFDAAGQRMAA